MQKIHLRSIAKVNLGLHIMGKLDNGYHLLETLFYPVPELYDDVYIEVIQEARCEVEMVGFNESVPLEKNLAWRAWDSLRKHDPDQVIGVKVSIEKRIPAGAGLGGGSSNAGTVMRGVNQLAGLNLSDDRLAQIAEPLGADVPFFIYGKPLYATGIGNRFEVLDIDLSAYRLEVKTLAVHSSTADAYRNLDVANIKHATPLKELLTLPVKDWKGKVLNDLEQSAFPRLPEIADAVRQLYDSGADYAAMTGSGSAVFGLYKNRSDL